MTPIEAAILWNRLCDFCDKHRPLAGENGKEYMKMALQLTAAQRQFDYLQWTEYAENIRNPAIVSPEEQRQQLAVWREQN